MEENKIKKERPQNKHLKRFTREECSANGKKARGVPKPKAVINKTMRDLAKDLLNTKLDKNSVDDKAKEKLEAYGFDFDKMCGKVIALLGLIERVEKNGDPQAWDRLCRVLDEKESADDENVTINVTVGGAEKTRTEK